MHNSVFFYIVCKYIISRDCVYLAYIILILLRLYKLELIISESTIENPNPICVWGVKD